MKMNLFVPVVLLTAHAIYAQKIVSATPGPVKLGQTVALELVMDVGADDMISWVAKGGKGQFRMGEDQRKVEFIPAGPGDSVLVVCRIVGGHGRKEVTLEIKLQGANSPSETVTPPALTPPGKPPAPPHPTPPPVQPEMQTAANADIMQLGFIPAGFMGSAQKGETVELDQGSTEQPHSEPVCIKLVYKPQTPETASDQSRVPWFAIAWQYTTGDPNWGDDPGRDLDAGREEPSRFHSLRVWARGTLTNGKPPVVQFKSGGGTKRGLEKEKQASYEVVDQFRPLTTSWSEYCLDLSKSRLSNVVSAFTIVMERAANSSGAVVYLDDIHFSTQHCPARTAR
jgi:hypothetical protein